MATTYVPLYTTTLGSPASSVTINSISAGYTDLVLVVDGQASGGQRNLLLQFNGDTGTNYSSTILYGDSSGAGSVRQANQNGANVGGIDTTSQSNTIAHIMNYSNSTTYKTIIGRGNSASNIVAAKVALWRNTSAITSIVASLTASDTFFTGCTFSLYGVAAANVGAKATGGDVIGNDGTYYYHAFRSSGTFTPLQSLTADVLVIAGGGGGGRPSSGAGFAGGGGAGGVLAYVAQSLSTAQTITIGAGGGINTNGSNSQFASLTASIGGGAGGGINIAGSAGGNGGGGGENSAGGTGSQGFNGGAGSTTGTGGGGGGAGAGANGITATNSSGGGAGGAGINTFASWGSLSAALAYTGSGVSGFIAGGGGGSADSAGVGIGGSGGGGAGGKNTSTPAAVSGTANTGSGGGGSTNVSFAAGNGGSGLVIVRYPI